MQEFLNWEESFLKCNRVDTISKKSEFKNKYVNIVFKYEWTL